MERKLIAFFMSVVIALLVPASVLANDEIVGSEEKQYLFITENENDYEEIYREIGAHAVTDVFGLEENRIVVAELTEEEAYALSEEVIVEEDIILSGSTMGDLLDEENQMNEENNEETECEWNIQAVNAEGKAFEENIKQKVKIAVLDSGVDYVTGINLAGYVNLIEGEEELSEIFQDFTGHGTGIASIISGNGETGICGVNPNAEVYSVKVLDGENKAPLSRIIQGIYWCIEHEMNIINMSFGTSVYSKALEQAVMDAYEAGLLMIGAAGNESSDVEYPAAFSEVMAVAAVNPEAEISEFSNTGEELDIAAPGEKIRVASFFDGNEVTHGTSIAVPHVTGAASLLWEKDLTKSNEFIRQLIQETAKSIKGTDECGLLDVAYAREMYDTFAAEYDERDASLRVEIPENTEQPECFKDVNTDETYVEGQWNGTNHKGAVDSGNSGLGFSSAVINVIKQGAVYPDQNANWTKGRIHPWWHGRWVTTEDTVWNETDNRNNWTHTIQNINYCSVLEMITKIAIRVGEIGKNDMTYNRSAGMKYYIFKEIAYDIDKLNYKSILSSNTKANRKYFLYGCAIHSITDAFAHSTTDSSGTRINHTSTSESADSIIHFPGRYKMAVYVTEYALKNLKNNQCSNGKTVLQGIKKKYQNGDVNFRMINIKPYLNENGCNDPVLDKLNINK